MPCSDSRAYDHPSYGVEVATSKLDAVVEVAVSVGHFVGESAPAFIYFASDQRSVDRARDRYAQWLCDTIRQMPCDQLDAMLAKHKHVAKWWKQHQEWDALVAERRSLIESARAKLTTAEFNAVQAGLPLLSQQP